MNTLESSFYRSKMEYYINCNVLKTFQVTVQNDYWQHFPVRLFSFLSFIFIFWKCINMECHKCLVLIFYVGSYYVYNNNNNNIYV